MPGGRTPNSSLVKVVCGLELAEAPQEIAVVLNVLLYIVGVPSFLVE